MQAVAEEWSSWVCPHVLGGIPPSVVDTVFPMRRDGRVYKSIDVVAEQ